MRLPDAAKVVKPVATLDRDRPAALASVATHQVVIFPYSSRKVQVARVAIRYSLHPER